MAQFGSSSMSRLVHLDTSLSLLCYDVLVHYNISILCTTRNSEEQAKSFLNGYSNAKFGSSPHNYDKSFAVDVGLWNSDIRGVDYNDSQSFKDVTDCFKLHAESRGIELEFGYDWGWDMPHIELKGWKLWSLDRPLVGHKRG